MFLSRENTLCLIFVNLPIRQSRSWFRGEDVWILTDWKFWQKWVRISIRKIQMHSLSLFLFDDQNYCDFSTLWAYNFGTVQRKKSKISLKNPKFIRDSVKQIKKYGYRVKNRSYLRFCLAKSRIFRREQRKMLFSNSRKNYYN